MADTRWINLQKNIFARYIEQKLRLAGAPRQLKDVVAELKDGSLLIQLVEILSGKQCPIKLKPAKMRIQQVENAAAALKFAKDCGVKASTSPEDLLDGSVKNVLALIFAVISKFMRLDDDPDTADVKQALVFWLRNRTQGYSNISIDNLTKSFHDGLALCALIHKLRPSLIPYDSLTNASKDDKEKNLNLAFSVAEKFCKVGKYLSPQDIVVLDEVGMIVYLYDWYAGISLLQKQDVACRRIGKLVDMTQLHDQMKEDYNTGSAALVSWIDARVAELNDRTVDNSMGGIKARLVRFNEFKDKEKSEKIVDHLNIVALFDNLALRLLNNHRPAFSPAIPPAVLEAKFTALEAAESDAGTFLYAEYQRQLRLDKEGKRFRAETARLEAWLAEKETVAGTVETASSEDEANDHLISFAQFEHEYRTVGNFRLDSVMKLLVELELEKYEYIDELQASQQKLVDTFARIDGLLVQKKQKLEDHLAEQQTINDDLYHTFAMACKDFSAWLQERSRKVADKSLSLEQQLEHVLSAQTDDATAQQKLADITAHDGRLQDRQLSNNPYTNVSVQDMRAQWTQFSILLSKKRELLENELDTRRRRGLSKECIQEIRDHFDHFDAQHSGLIDKRDVKNCLQTLGEEATAAVVNELMDEYDSDKDGKLNKEEFVQLMVKRMGDTNTEEEILRGFDLLSYDKDYVTTEVLRSIINPNTFKESHLEYMTSHMPALGEGFDYKKWTKEVFSR